MKILVIGQGAREHALGWKLKEENPKNELAFSPGNGGTELVGKNLNSYANGNSGFHADLVVIGPEAPLAQGIADNLETSGFKVFGPKRSGARLEASKIFAKTFMDRHQIPTARFQTFDELSSALSYVEKISFPLVIKADGLAQGKGAAVISNLEQAKKTLTNWMEHEMLGPAGKKVLIEEFLEGEEASVMAFFDGRHFVYIPPARDYKRLSKSSQAPMTGGMGCIAPIPFDRRIWEAFLEEIAKPFQKAVEQEAIAYRGIIYFGLMVTSKGPRVLEFNVRFGDPETQALLPLIDISLSELMMATSEGLLSKFDSNILLGKLDSNPKYSVCVVLASPGYPANSVLGQEIHFKSPYPNLSSDTFIFHAGTLKQENRWLTSGGRVLSIVGLGKTFSQAQTKAYQGIEQVRFEGMQYRNDIGMAPLPSSHAS